jgi:hypothetical protein
MARGRLVISLLFAAAALVCAQTALADTLDYSNLAWSVGSKHAVVHYSTTKGDDDAITLDQARRILATVETLWATETGWGFAAPNEDGLLGGDGRLDIFVKNAPDHRSFAQGGFTPARTSAAYLNLDPHNVFGAGSARRFNGTIAHELFHAIQFHYAFEAPFLAEATAEWAAIHAAPKDYMGAPPLFVDVPEASLDCPGEVCGDPANLGAGYGQWPFFEYLSQRFGRKVIRETWAAARELQAPELLTFPPDLQSHALEALDAALRLHKSSLSQAYGGYVRANLTPRWYRNRLLRTIVDLRPPRKLELVGARPKKLKTENVIVDHLASTSITYATPGCVVGRKAPRAVLHIKVDLPGGVSSRPLFRFTDGARRPTVKALSISSGVASIDVPRWGGCVSGTLAVPNLSWATDDALFAVHLSVTAAAGLLNRS